MKKRNLKGQKFGNLTVIKEHGRDKYKNVLWECLCDCGEKTIVTSGNLVTGHTKSCGCLQKTSTILSNTKHGYARRGKNHSRLYSIWSGMTQRCQNPKSNSYKNYGERGISVCKDWENFENFKDWSLQNGYQESLSIDRIDVNGDYCPKNCKWSTRIEQANNKRSTKRYLFNKENLTVAEISSKYNLKYEKTRELINVGRIKDIELTVNSNRFGRCLDGKDRIQGD